MKSSPVPTRRPSLLQLFGLRDRTNVPVAPPAPADPAVPAAKDLIDAPQKTKRKKEKTKKAEYDEAALVRAYGRAFVSEVALLQFMDGGSTEHNVRRVLKRRAKLEREDEARTRLLPQDVLAA